MIAALFFAAAVNLTKPAPPPNLNAPPADAQKSSDGLISKQLAAGTDGAPPAATDLIHIRYAVWKASDGSVIDYTRSEVPTFVDMSKLLPGMREMFAQMTPGEKRRAWIPASLGAGKIKEGDMFVVDGELVDVVHPPSAPADVTASPADAMKTPSGLAYKILRPGTGTVHPKTHEKVLVHYSGWTTDGQMFDSSIRRGEPLETSLADVIPGWTEGLRLMTEGEQVRFWIPQKLAYKGKAGMPAGMLVFDVELLKIKN
jgi:FKBP-type peptidyl-prolyl cis-trans isomerase